MKKVKIFGVFILISLLFMSCKEPELVVGNYDIIPLPQTLIKAEGHFQIDSRTVISVENEEQKKIALQLASDLNDASGWNLVVSSEKEGQILFKEDKDIKEEAYYFTVSAERIVITASSGAGYFYGVQTLKQMLPAAFFGENSDSNKVWGIPLVSIKDEPAFEWRGYMLDVSRHFFEVEQVKKVIDFMGELKLNRFHWHLTDDQGWRLEIKKYPKLTEVEQAAGKR